MAVQAKLLAKDPERPEYRAELARSEGNLGILFASQGDAQRAERQYRQGIALLEEHEPKAMPAPAMPGYLGELINIYTNLANLMIASNKPAEAEKSWLRLVELRERLVQSFPANANFRTAFVGALSELGNRARQNQKLGEAKVLYGKAVEHLQELARQPDAPSETWSNLYLMQLNLASSLVDLKDHAAAFRVLRQLTTKAGVKKRQDHRAAALLARSASLVDRDKQLPPNERLELTKTYGDEAIALLRRAIQEGFQDVEFIGTPDFEALRNRQDFEQLVKELTQKRG
jgi:hypothetical protein